MHREAGGLVRIIGHASARTETSDLLRQKIGNLRMSLARANAVAAALVGMGVEADRIQVAGAGDTELVYDESSPAGEAGNRRAEIYLDF
jgi:flagellar motor protein MotB